jgi:hypothetical protein
MEKIFVIPAAMLILSLAGCSLGVAGSGTMATEKRDVPAFTAVDAAIVGNVNITCQASQEVSLTGDDNILPLIETEVKDGTLYIKPKEVYQAKNSLTINISAPDVQKLVFTGVGNAKLTNVKNEKIVIELTGTGNVEAEGETKDAELRLMGVGEFNAQQLHAENVTVNSTGSGNISAYATKQIDGKLDGVGDLNYYGNPTSVKVKTVGVGKVNPM